MMNLLKHSHIIPIALALLIISAPCLLTAQERYELKVHYTKSEHMVPMRDGVKLFTTVYAPKDQAVSYPIMLFRTPYGTTPHGLNNYKSLLGPSALYTREGFIFIYQDVRGKGPSEGHFVVMRPFIADPQGSEDTDESTDTYDTVEWALKNIANNNGRVGQWGISYPGFQTAMGMIRAHPAMKASSPQASPVDMYIGDDFHHNGAFRLMYTFGWLASNAQFRAKPGEEPRPFGYGTNNGYKYFLDIGPIRNIKQLYFQDRVPTWNEYMEHGDYDDYWEPQNFLKHLTNIDHAILNVAGWFDAEDFYGPMSIYYTIEQRNYQNDSTLVVGPWRHGGWTRGTGDSLGDISFGSNTSQYYLNEVEFPFFNYHLKGKGKNDRPEAVVFETGANQWRKFEQWPPQSIRTGKLFFHPGGKLSFKPPSASDASSADSYVSDPAKPVPFSASARKLLSQGHVWMIEDQRFAAARSDVLTYQTAVLSEDVTIAGPIIASMFASTSGTDSDWIVKLIDVFPPNAPAHKIDERTIDMGDFQMLLAGEVMRGKYRNSYTKPEPMASNQATLIEFDLRDRFHTFRAGHRIMVQVQSSWFPVIDRNPQRFVDIYTCDETAFQKATQKIYHSEQLPSHIKLGVLPKKKQ